MTAPNLEQIIADHERVRMMRLATCRCGWEEPIYDRDATALHAAHVVAAIRDSGYTVIALPEPSEYLPGERPSWSRAISVAVDRFNEIIVGRTWWINRHEAADLGAALIAAAQHATGDTQ